jgi:hypothetical protein
LAFKTPSNILEKNRRYRIRNREAVLYHKRNARLRRFGLEPEDLTKMLEEQNYQCLICRRKLEREGRKLTSAHLDHCHKCGKLRGLLCKRCNTMMGFIESDEETFFKGMTYYINHFSDHK